MKKNEEIQSAPVANGSGVGDPNPVPETTLEGGPQLPLQPRQGRRNMFDMAQLEADTLEGLRDRAKDLGISGYSKQKNDQVIFL